MKMSEQQQEELLALIAEAQLNVIKAIASTYTVEQLEQALSIRQQMDAGKAQTAKADMSAKIDPFDMSACSIGPDSQCGED